MKHVLWMCLLATTNTHAQVAVNLPTGQSIDPLAAFQVCGTTRLDSLPFAPNPTHVLVLDQNDSILHKLTLASFVVLIQQSLASPPPVIRVFEHDTVWSKPPGLKYIVVEMVGGGGGGGGCYNYGGGAGAAAGYTKKIISKASLSATETVTIGIGGAGGAPQSPGDDGGTSSFGAHCSATGGQGGKAQTTSVSSTIGSAGGIGLNGDINLTGSGSGGVTGPSEPRYIGANSVFGGSAQANGSYSSNDGFSATSYGAGGSGGSCYNILNKKGGSGSNGIIIVTEYY